MPVTALGPPVPCDAAHAGNGSRPVPQTRWKIRSLVLVAVAFGVVFGAMACASGMAANAGHATHASPTLSAAPVIEAFAPETSHVVHGRSTSEAVDPSTDAPSPGDEHERSESPEAQGHPGMACVVSVDLDVPDVDVRAVGDEFDAPPSTAPVECSADLDPPVPRSS